MANPIEGTAKTEKAISDQTKRYSQADQVLEEMGLSSARCSNTLLQEAHKLLHGPIQATGRFVTGGAKEALGSNEVLAAVLMTTNALDRQSKMAESEKKYELAEKGYKKEIEFYEEARFISEPYCDNQLAHLYADLSRVQALEHHNGESQRSLAEAMKWGRISFAELKNEPMGKTMGKEHFPDNLVDFADPKKATPENGFGRFGFSTRKK